MTITGKGAANTIIQAAASPNVATWRIFQVTSTGNLTLDGVTVRNRRCNGSCTVVGGIHPNAGGGIYNNGILTVTNSAFSWNNSSTTGGAIYSNSTLTVINSTISNNSARAGGGIFNHDNGTGTVSNSTIVGNSTIDDGGGIFNLAATLTVINSTISDNVATYGGGGGILNAVNATLTLTNSTVSKNMAADGGGIRNFSSIAMTVTNSTISGNYADFEGGGIYDPVGITELRNTIVANNIGRNCFGTITNGGNNLQFGGTVANSCGTSIPTGDPKLGPLANNGGHTKTMALLAGSPAIDAIPVVSGSCNDTGVTKDQRDGTRPQGAGCDIGAYEFGTPVTFYSRFSDVPDNYWALVFIERLYDAGITGGCGNGNYCPEGVVTRAQMAIFLLRGIHGSSYAPPTVGGSTGFADVPTTYWAAAWIKQLAAEGITGGCGSGNYCPEVVVTRAQMAIFLLRAKHGAGYTPPAVGGSTGFTDVPPSYWAAAWIKQLVAEGITSGCGPGTYCPESPVTRAQMAVFLVRTFNLP
jgi:predicted outer membrane repeat protein